MYLSRLDLYGFKSFAQRTVLELSSGVTCVVGPNGCGKTNILDAVRWVLGEQRSATLRSDRMESVIFAGSLQRRPLGMAEVSLTIENSRGILPVEYGEIVLTRRLYRSGESEYLMNRQPCRLKDINDLFMDTGMGAGSYSVIELKMVEDLLSDRPEERRQLFEEAAGITKYKHRRRAALRKLEETRQHMLRLEDVVAEAERQVAALKRQVGRTERHRDLSRELRETELSLAREDLLRWSARLAPLRRRLEEGGLATARLEAELARQGSLLSSQANELLRAEEAVAEGDLVLRQRWEDCRRLEDEALVARERLKALERDQARLEREAAELEPRLRESRGRESLLARQVEEAGARQAELDAALEKAASLAGQAESRLDNLRGQLELARARVLDLLGKQSNLGSEQAAAAAGLEGHRRRCADLEADQAQLGEERTKRAGLRQEVEGRLAKAQAGKREREESRRQAGEEVEAAREGLQEARAQLQELRSEERALEGRRQLLEQLLSRFEGVPGGARAVLEAGLPGVPDMLGNLVHAEAEHLPALESALGEAAGWILVEDGAAAHAAAQVLRRAGKGGCTLARLDRLPPVAERAESAPAGCRPLLGVLRCDGRVRPLLEHLLAGCWLVDDAGVAPWESAAGLFVLPDGESRRPPFLSRHGRGGGGHLGLRYQVEHMQEDGAALAARRTEQESLVAAREELLQQRRLALEGAEAAVQAAAGELRDLERERERLALEEERAGRDAEGARRSLTTLAGQVRELETRERSLRRQLDDLQAGRDEAEGENLRLATLLDEQAARTRILVEERGAAQMAAAGGLLQLEAHRREREDLRRFLAEGGVRLARAAGERSEGEERRTRLGERLGELERLQIAAALAREEEEARQEERRARQAELRGRQRELREGEDALRSRRDGLKDEGHQAELEARGLEARIAALVERIQAEHELVLEPPAPGSLEEAPAGDDEAADEARREEARRRVVELKDALRRLGPVNLLAIEEFEEESRRAGFLRAQLNDLLEAEAMLKETIGRINRVARELFEETFSSIRANFEYLFRKLFTDGRADLALEGEDPLEAEIQISATPSGKRIQNLMLMSGGEKTLTAIALLFAIYMVKPSPFCILDEVDAPLDDANIARFNTLIQEFSGMTQFIIITHNKKTMGYADQLYGVTMAEEGVSSIVSVQFHEGA
ncbi:MAG: chromosome segregation protein SMC [bacterium]|jgi:chromosome segregation protein|nr:chromosome segregation protein SMC [bacterium]